MIEASDARASDDTNAKAAECLMQMAMPNKSWFYVLFVLVHIGTSSASAANAGCPQSGAEIATDRPDVTNSSLVVPRGSLQNESGVNLTSKDGARILDGTNNRLRSGIAPSLEVLVDLTTYFATVRGQASSGFSDVAPAVKWQISPVPGVLDLSITAGVGLPTGTTAVAGPGIQPYLQFPWSRELGDGWGISGMLTSFFIPADPTSKFSQQVTSQSKKRSATAPICSWSMSAAIRRTAALAKFSTQAVLIASRRRSRSISISLSVSTAMRLPGFSESDIHFGWMVCLQVWQPGEINFPSSPPLLTSARWAPEVPNAQKCPRRRAKKMTFNIFIFSPRIVGAEICRPQWE
jgi:hypothetical protein